MFNFRKRHPNTPVIQSPGWFKWGILIFIALIFFAASRSEEGKPSSLQATIENIKNQVPDAEIYTSVIPDDPITLSHAELKPGNGQTILCGQQMTVTYQLYHGDEQVGSGEGAFTLIPSDNSSQLRSFVSAMQFGEQRRFTLSQPAQSSQWFADEPSQKITHFDIALTHVTPDVSSLFNASALGVKLFDETIGEGKIARCGEQAQVSYRVFHGNTSNEGQAHFTIGDGKVIAGLEQGVIGMQPGGKRVMILPSAWQQHIYQHAEPDTNITAASDNQLMVLEVTRIK